MILFVLVSRRAIKKGGQWARTPDVRREPLHDHIRRDLKEDVRYEKNCQRHIWLVARHARIFDQAHGQGIRDINTIQSSVSPQIY